MKTLIYILCFLFLVACGPIKSSHVKLGKVVKSPTGWTVFCENNPTDPMCK